MARCEDIQPRLSAYVDGTAGDETADVRAHIEGCDACRGLADDLVRVRDAAGALGPMAPPDDVWRRLSGELAPGAPAGTPPAPTRAVAPMQQWIGLAAALVLVTLGLYVVDRMTTVEQTEGNVVTDASVEGVNEELGYALDHYENAISQLKTLAASGTDTLDPEVAAAFDRNMNVVDRAITESREALASDPNSQPARASLLEALSQKVNVLQATVTLINEMRQGDAAGAAEATGSSTKSS